MPMDFKHGVPYGEVFLNAVSPEAALELWDVLDGPQGENGSFAVCWNTKVQGLDALIKKYRNYSVMHPAVHEKAKPRLFKDGESMAFPAPTRKVKFPRARA